MRMRRRTPRQPIIAGRQDDTWGVAAVVQIAKRAVLAAVWVAADVSPPSLATELDFSPSCLIWTQKRKAENVLMHVAQK